MVIWEQDTVYSFPLLYFTVVHLAAFLAFHPFLLFFVKTFQRYLLTQFATTRIALMFSKCKIIGEGCTATMALWW
jgi:hypothetical protein